MIVVSNTSPIINLAAIGQLELLQHLYGTIAIPQAVYHEIAVIGILLVAKQRGYLVAIKPLLHNLMTVAGFWIDQELYKRVLESAQEL